MLAACALPRGRDAYIEVGRGIEASPLTFCSPTTTNTHSSIMCDDEVAALVVDNGSGMCKAGFAGDDAPR